MIDTSQRQELKDYLCDSIRLIPTAQFKVIGNVGAGGEVLGVVGYDNFTRRMCEMHIAGETGWLTRKMIWSMFHYPFIYCDLSIVMSKVSSANTKSLEVVRRLGAQLECTIKDGCEDGDMCLFSLRKENCRWI